MQPRGKLTNWLVKYRQIRRARNPYELKAVRVG